ncbi:tetratricopeptide repeat protein, partial [Limnohabitans sp. JirII-31]|uniref:tetratricopeptide repeat protein n=1 Tax=Limnohabitans sp. JirII-31 TaxID=1977908 RepID=UPI001E5651E0
MLMVDDGSPVLPEWSDFEVLTELPAQRPSAKKVLFHFSNNLGRQSNLHHPGWFRSFGFAAQYAKAHQFTKIVHIESDAYLMSTRMFDFVNNSQTGWTTFWCPRWQCEEIAIQVVCEDQFDTYERITQQDYGSVYAGKVIEKMLPYTSVRKDFVGDRYAEGNGSIPLNVDYVCQFQTELEIGALVKRVKQQLSLPAPSQQGQEDVGKLFEQGLALHKQGQLVRAKMLYEAVLKKNPKHFDALNALGVAEINFENYREAVNLISSALLENKKSAEAYYNLGLGLDGLNLKAQAIEAYDECLKLDPKNFSALNNKSKTQRDIGKYEEAIVSSSAAIAIKSDYAVAYLNRAIAFMELKQFEAAIASFDQAIGIKPGNAEAYFNRGNAQMELKQFEAALASYDRAINTKPDYADAYFKKGLTLQELKQLPTAVASYDKAISVKPDFANAYLNRGSVLSKLKQLDAALDSYNKAISIKPDFVQAYSNRAVVLKDLGQIEAALASYDEAISINPDYAGVYWNKSFTLLLSGRFEEGWKLYEWRWKHEGLGLKLPNFSQPLWLGVESLQGQTILLHSEQGLGDTIQFCRYAKLVKALGAHVVMESPTALVPLLQGLEGVDELVARGQALPAFDYHCPLLSLPLAFKTELSTIPSSEPYLRSDKAKVKQWRAKLGRKTKPRVGLVWSGSTGHTNDHNRSFKLEELLPYLPDGFEYVCLQKEIREVDQEMLQQSSIQYFGDELENFADTAALCELMDVVISVDTSVAHLSGALGKPTWVLLSYSPDWRWLLDREDSPWYGSVKLYRQDADRTWSSVLHRVSRSLLSQAKLPVANSVGVQQITKKFMAGLTAFQNSQPVQAKSILEDLLKDAPNHFDAMHLYGIVLGQLQETKKSIEIFKRAIEIQPNSADVHSNLGNAYKDDGQHELAITHCEMAIRLNANHASAYTNRAIALQKLERLDEALVSYDKAIALNPNNHENYLNKGVILRTRNNFDEALKSFEKTIELKRDCAEAYFNCGLVLKQQHHYEAALSSYDKAISIKPDYVDALINKGNTLQALKQFEAAVVSYNQAISLEPNYAEAYYNRGIAQMSLKRSADALDSYDKAIYLKTDYAGAHWSKSLACLLFSQFEEGWKLYEWRWKYEGLDSKLPDFSQPRWLGVESLQGQTILLHSEQGLGDTIQFCRYAKLVKALGARVVMEVPAPLVPLLESLEGVDELVEKGQALPAFDYHCPLLSLPLAFKTELSTIPSPEPYLRSDKAKVKRWRAKLGRKTKPRIGLVWSGSTVHKNDRNRSLTLDELTPYLPEGFAYVCLQNEIRDVDQEALQQSSIQYFGDELENFADTAALCELMDMVISVDTSVAHLSGALGKSTWVLLQHVPDWRWLLDREDSPWYGSVKLYRQDADRTWSSVLHRVSRSLLSQAKLPVANSVGVQQIAKNFMLELQVVGETEHSSEVQLLQLFTKGLSFHKEGQLAQAKAIYEAVLQIKPTYFDALHMLGVIALTWNDADLSVSLIGKALIENKSNSDAFFNYGLALHANAQPLSAVESYDSAISLNRDNDKIYWNKSLSLLLLGKLYEGWQLYEYGWRGSQQRGIPLVSSQPLWLGVESLQGQTILLHSEQGLGDTIQFCRYAKLVKALGAHVVMESPTALVPLLQGLEGVDELVARGQALPAFDYHCPLLSLPLAFKTELSTIPSSEPYLRSDKAKVKQWRAKLGRKTKPRIGLVWSGSAVHKNDRNRSLTLDELTPYLPEGFAYVCLQNEIRDVDQEALKQSSIQYVGDELKDFADTAALCELMDVVISVDTSVAHLSGALGKSTWVLLPYVPDWRWLLDREDSPWYGSVKLYRQDADRTWSSVLHGVSRSLLSQAKLPVANSVGVQQIAKNFMAGLTAFQNSQPVQAKSILEDLLRDAPNHFDAMHLYGIVLGQLQETKKSIEIFKRAIEIQPNSADVHSNLGNAYKDDGQYELAITHCDIAIGLNAKHSSAYTNRAIALQQLERLDEALISYDKAIALNPNNHENYYNRGNAQMALMQSEAAVDSYDKAISLKPDYAGAHWNKSLELLALGQFKEGWKSYEWRWKHEDLGSKLPNFSQPQWLGVESLQGQTILLHSEQGLGDTIQFCRYAKLVKALGARVVMEAPAALLPLLQSLEGVDELVAKGQALPAFDYHCPLLSLPLAFKTELSTIPSPEPYLRSDSVKVAQWRTKLGRKTKPRIGLVWSGNPAFKGDQNRSLKLQELMPYLPEGFEYVCLQKEIREVDQETLKQSSVRYFGHELENFADTAALCELMDVVISTCTSVAHLSGALGKSTWVLLPYVPDWRWLLDREDSPWYGSVKLYRQDADRSWSSVLERVAGALLDCDKLPVASNAASSQNMTKLMAGLNSFQNGQAVQAKSILEDLLNDTPNHFDGLHLYGIVLGQLQETKKSIEIFKRAIRIKANNADVHSNLGNAYKDDRQYEQAVAHCDIAIGLNAKHFAAYTNRAIALQQLERLDEALISYDNAIALNSNNHENYLNKGVILRTLKNFDEALKSFEKTIELKSDCAEAYYNLGDAQAYLKQFETALSSYDKAISIKPDYVDAYINKGNTLQALKQFEVAVASYDRAISLQPDYAKAYYNRGNAQMALMQSEAAVDSYDKAISLKPDYAGAHWNKSLELLALGQFKEGWKSYEWRWKHE